jgi:hypothetical protein
MPGYAKDFLHETVNRYMPRHLDIPLGAVVAKAFLVACVPTDDLLRECGMRAFQHHVPFEQELMFGNYENGRWAWLLKDVVPVIPAVPALGHQGIWEWSESL